MMKKIKLMIALAALSGFIAVPQSKAFTDGSGWVQVGYLIKILEENYRRYQQLQMMIKQAKNNEDYLRLVNQGLDDFTGIMATLPIKDEKILGELRNFQDAYSKVESIYGGIPRSGEYGMHELHDRTVAESFEVINSTRTYSEQQNANAASISRQSASVSPKGAGRLNAQANAQILQTLNQLLTVNGQMLKVNSATLALMNKDSKGSVEGFNRVNNDVGETLGSFNGDFNLPRF